MESTALFGVTSPFLQSAEGGKKLLVCLLERVLTRPFLQSPWSWRFGRLGGACYVGDNRGGPGDILCSSLDVAHASRSDMLAGLPCSQGRLRAFPFATSACGRAGSLCHRNIADSLHEGREQTSAHSVRTGSLSSWPPPAEKTINLSVRRREKGKTKNNNQIQGSKRILRAQNEGKPTAC